MHVSVIIARKENEGKFLSLLSLVFVGFWKWLSAENVPYPQEGMADQSLVKITEPTFTYRE